MRETRAKLASSRHQAARGNPAAHARRLAGRRHRVTSGHHPRGIVHRRRREGKAWDRVVRVPPRSRLGLAAGRSRLAGAGLAASAIAGCQPAIPAYTVNVPPRLVDLRPPRSIAIVHGDVSLDGARAAIEHAIARDVTGSKKLDLGVVRDVDLTWHLTRRPVVLRGEKDGLGLEVDLLGDVGAQGGGIQCHAGDAGVVFRADTAPTLRPGGELALDHLNWKPELRGKLDCGPVTVPMGDILDAVVGPIAAALAKGVDVAPRVTLGACAPGRRRTRRIPGRSCALSGDRTVSAGPPVVALSTKAARVLPGQVASREGALVAQPLVSGQAEIRIDAKK